MSPHSPVLLGGCLVFLLGARENGLLQDRCRFHTLSDAFVVDLTKNEDLSIRSGGKPAYSVYACRVFRSARRCSCCCTFDFVCIHAGPPCGRSSMGDAHLVAVLRAMLEVRDGKLRWFRYYFGTAHQTKQQKMLHISQDNLPAPPRPNQSDWCVVVAGVVIVAAATPTQTK